MKRSTRPDTDVYGKELMAFYKGEGDGEIVERDDGLIMMGGPYGRKYYLSKFKDWAPIEKKALGYVKGRVLDVGCGAGRHSLYLQQKGHPVVGMDNSPLALKVCRLRGLKRTELLPIEKIGRLRTGSFDSILMLGNNFGLFGSFKKARRLLAKMHRMTGPDAVFIVQTLDPHQTKNPLHLEYHRSNRRKGRMAGQVRIRIRFQDLIGTWMDYLLVSEKEMAAILKGTGWSIKKIFRSKDPVYIAVIQKVAG